MLIIKTKQKNPQITKETTSCWAPLLYLLIQWDWRGVKICIFKTFPEDVAVIPPGTTL
jgi:predicted transglutaminase-like protease